MEAIWVSCIIIANIIMYIRKFILMRAGYIVGLFISYDYAHMCQFIETQDSSRRRYCLMLFNLSPYLFAIAGILLAMLDSGFSGIEYRIENYG